MRFSRRDKLAGVVLALICAFLAWRVYDRGLLRRSPDSSTNAAAARAARQPLLVTSRPPAVVASVPATPKWVPVTTLAARVAPHFRDEQWTNRLRNTPAPMGQLLRRDSAILLRNALVDTASGEPLEIPAALRARQTPDAYVVQARGAITAAFRDRLIQAGATVVSYVPNNALLVRASAGVAEQLAVAADTAGVLPLEPYFKLTPGLLTLALAGQPLPDDLRLVLTVPEAAEAGAELAALGAKEVFRERGPFGALLTVEAPRDSLVALAQLPLVHRIEPQRRVKLANDLAAYSLGSTTVPENTNSFLDLDGSGVLVNLNDSGVDAKHPDLIGRVFVLTNQPQMRTDPDGHGTHVAGIIAGDGTESDTINNPPPQGSLTNANFKGKASKAKLYVLQVDLLTGPPSGDAYLQETAAVAPERGNSEEDVLISNNSWGYNGLDQFEYSSHSASYDAAVRDALPEKPGDQPILYVFSAGNSGAGGDNGVGGVPDTIESPGNAKNVITVGALENFRSLTNSVVYDTNGQPVQVGNVVIQPGWETNTGGTYFTNQPFLPLTDTDWQVASYSSRGNVGIGIEGPEGRFKPDVVAPGSFVASTRSQQWSPTVVPPDDPLFPYYELFNEADAQLAPWYRYELGTSMAAPAISGLLAQLQQYFEQRVLQFPSAAAYKALMINSAQATSSGYVPGAGDVINYAGWGKPNLQRALGRGFKARVGGQDTDVIGYDEPYGIATGESRDITLQLTATNALDQPLRLALVWTDPPGDPIVGPKLVNDLDLIVSNTITGEIFLGNDFNPDTSMSRPHPTNEITTNGLPLMDRINNVERIILPPPLSTNYVITVVAYRVNVNARRDATNAIVQDFALAFSSDVDATVTNAIGLLDAASGLNPVAVSYTRPPTLTITNGLALLNQRAGANSPLIGGTNGDFKQWQFYNFTNVPGTTTNGGLIMTNGSNVAFVTFEVGSLSRGRTNGPDVDLYVSRDPGLTNLNPDVIAAAQKSTTRGGNELVFYTNAPLGNDVVFYVGVKSEDHQGGEYGFIGLSTDQPLTRFDKNGNAHPLAIPLQRPIPDGTSSAPGVGLWAAISVLPLQIRSVYPDVTVTHQNFPDLLNQLTFNRQSAVLQNHTKLLGREAGTNLNVFYDDTGSGIPGAIPSDGPGSLINFLGDFGVGAWFLSTVDNALGNTGTNVAFDLSLAPNLFGNRFIQICPGAKLGVVEIVDIPPEASRMTIVVTNMDPELPLQVFIKREELPGQFPDLTDPANNDKYAEIQPPGGSVSIGIRDVPPLQAGRYIVVFFNPNEVQVCADVAVHVERNLDASFTRTFTSDDPGPIPDAARRFSLINVDDPRRVTSADVGVRIDHPRVSDLVLRLQNPRGWSAVVVENRGGDEATGFGTSVVSTNGVYQHVALTYEAASSQAILYINGVVAAQRGLPPGFVPATTNIFYFALDPSYQFRNQGVKLDDFGMWRRALRPQEVRDIYLNGLSGEAKTPSDQINGLFALWPFNGNGDDLFGPYRAGLQLAQPVPGAFPGVPGELGMLFGDIAFGEVTNGIALPRGTGFTLEGWVAVPSPATNAVIAGWWSDSTRFVYGPGLIAGGAAGKGSVTAILTDARGNQVQLSSAAGALSPNRLVTNTLFATFSENTNRASEKIKFAPPPFTGQLGEAEVLSLDDFEGEVPTTYPAGSSFGEWTVVSNSVAILADAALAYQGTQSLAVSNGVVRRTFPAAVGEHYQIAFFSRLAPGGSGVVPPQVLVDGFSVPLPAATSDWTTNSYPVRATKPNVTIDFVGLGTATNSSGLLVDNVQFIETKGAVSYLSEEDLSPLMGAGPGTWSLELDDTRTPYVGDLLSWQLTLTFAPTSAPAIRLTNGVSFATNVVGQEPRYFFIDVPLEATVATNWLQSVTGGSLALWYNPTGIPGAGALPEDYPLIFPTTGTAPNYRVIGTNVPPRLVPGQRYYLSVNNLDPSQSNQFVVEVDLGIKITPLTNGVPYSATNANNGLFDYYSFDVSTNAIGVTFQLTNLTDNLQLVARKGPQLPTRTQFDYASTNSGVQAEVIRIDQSSQPVPLSPGTWYLGVYSDSTNLGAAISYTILASEVTGSVIPLTNGIPYNGKITNSGQVAYFYLDITNDPIVGTFALSNLTANANLYLRLGLPLPSTNGFDYASTNAGKTADVITLIPGSLPIPLSIGRWFLAVVPVDPVPISFTVVGTYVENTFTIIPLEDGVAFDYFDAPPTNSLYFSFLAPPGTSALLFEIYGLTDTADLFVSRGVLPPYALPPNIYSQLRPGTLSERVVVRSNTVPGLAGQWYLQVDVTSTNSMNFSVRAATQQDGLLLSGDTLGSQYIPGNPPSLLIETVPGELYTTYCTADLSTPFALWTPVDTSVAVGDTLLVTLPPPSPGEAQRFYIVQQEKQ